MNPGYLLSEWIFSLKRGKQIKDRWILGRNAFLQRVRMYQQQVPKDDKGGIDQVEFDAWGHRHVVALRQGTDDNAVLMQVFHYKEYNPGFLDWSDVRTVVDAGANIGMSSLLFHSLAPKAKIFALEPDAANLAVLRMNVDSLNGAVAEILPAAIWIHGDGVDFETAGATVSHAIGTSASSVRVASVTPQTLVERLGGGIDVFKMDIEGAERDIFFHPSVEQWVRSVRYFFIECHGRLGADRGAKTGEIVRILAAHGFEVNVYDEEKELVFARRR